MGIKTQLCRIKFLPYAATHMYWCEFWNALRYRRNQKKRVAKNWIVYQEYRTAVTKKLRNKYGEFAKESAEKILDESKNLDHNRCNKVWIYWAQGFDSAPDLVKLCAQSIAYNLGGGHVVTQLSDNNISDYVSFPDFILDKYRKGFISKTFFSDLLRLELLIKHGGLWLDSTILCSNTNIPSYMTDSELFLFRTNPMENRIIPTQIESFFICAKTNNPLLILCRELLYNYLKRYNFLVDYYILYEMFELALEAMPEEWEKVVYYPRTDIFTLADEAYKPYNKKLIDILLERFPFHKLSYKEPRCENSAIDYLIEHSNLILNK